MLSQQPIELLRLKAPQKNKVCLECGICLRHIGDEHEKTCKWMIDYLVEYREEVRLN